MIFACCDERRRAAVLGHAAINGIDYLEVVDHAAIPLASPRQRTLLVRCLRAAPTGLTPANVLIAGGERITGITAQWIAPAVPAPAEASAAEAAWFAALEQPANVLVIRTSVAGDFSPYTLSLVNDAAQASADNSFDVTEVLDGFDPQLAAVTFSFKVECGPDFDCKPVTGCGAALPTPPPINYLAKDYGSFRTILLDRLRQLLPGWQGASEADMGVVLAELLAYAGDQLSYRQDAVTTEAFIDTARSRVSLRRHALLVDYHVHDGCNARVWMSLTVAVPVYLDRTATRFYTSAPGMPSSLAVGAGNERAALGAGVIVFEPMQDANLLPEHNQMRFHTWGDTNCCLPRGATQATLLGSYPDLQAGDVLIVKEMLGPQTGLPADADMRHRCAVRLTSVATSNARGQPLVDPLFEEGTGAPITSSLQRPTPVTQIRWSDEDALPFPVCVSSTIADANGRERLLTDVSALLGNVVLADQGLSMTGADLGEVPAPTLFHPPLATSRCDPAAPVAFPVRFRPLIADRPLTQAVPLPLAGSPVTPGAVPLRASGPVSLVDANGFTCLTVRAEAPLSWPQYFGIVATPNATDPSAFDLSVVFDPPGGPAGLSAPAVLERFARLTLVPATANYAPTRINALSRFITVPASYTPPAASPVAFPAAPTMLPASGPIDLDDQGNAPYLTVAPTNPLSWPPLFGVLAQGELLTPDVFNLLLVYQPPAGGVGVPVPVVVEAFDDVSLGNVAAKFGAASDLVSVRSFEDEPNPDLSASALMSFDASGSVPAITLTGTLHTVDTTWHAVPDLLASGPADACFVVEVESDGTATLRFGDGTNGMRPATTTAFSASYRVGSGSAGNVGAESLINCAADPRVLGCVNPLPAGGGIDAESSEQIRRRAPQAFLTQERAVTMCDYATLAESDPRIEDAAAIPRWTGSWSTVFITVEPSGGGVPGGTLRHGVARKVDAFRLAGQDFELEGPDYVPLDIELTVCVDPDYVQRDVQKALLEALGSGTLPDGQPAFFAPGRFKLGQTVYLSPIYTAARAVAGVQSVSATVFQPQGVQTSVWLHRAEIALGPFQAARMDNDPSLPDHGRLRLVMRGGK
ncbi:putative baseplate assembly protein [Paraburkholderia sp. SIMBA_049]